MASDIEMFSPSIDGIAPGISSRRQARNDLQSMCPRVKSADVIVLATSRSVDRFYLSIMENAFLHVESSVRAPDEVMNGMVAIFAPEAMKEDSLLIGLAVTVSVLEENEVRLLRNIDPVLAELESERKV